MTESNGKAVYVLSSEVGDVGGAAKATCLLCEALVEIGKEVTLFVTLRPKKAIAERLKALGITIVIPYLNRGWRFTIPQRLIALQLFVRSARHQSLMIHSVSLSMEARYLLTLARSAAPIYLWETTEALPHVKFLDRKIHQHLHKAEAILAPSRTIATNIRRTYSYSGPIKLLPFWIEKPADVLRYKLHKRVGNILYIGRMDNEKGLNYLFDGFTEYTRKYGSDLTLTVCGGGAADPIRELAQGNPSIDVRGYVDATQYEQAIEHCDVVVLPSLHEGYPLTLLEACARSRPVIASTVGSIPEVFGGRQCAILVPPRDSSALVSAISTIMTESDTSYHARCADAFQLFEHVSAIHGVRERLCAIYHT